MRRKAVLLVLVAVVLVAAGCSREEAGQLAEPQAQKWTVKGKLEGMNPEQKTVTINHQDIPGLMAAMTMAFQVEDAAILEGLSESDAVEFVLEQRASGLTVTSLRKISDAELEATSEGRTFEGKGMVMVVNQKVGAIVLQHEGAGDLPPGELILPVVPPSQLEGLEDETPVEFKLSMKEGQLVVSELKRLPRK